MAQSTIHIAILASGGGSNAQALLDRFRNHPAIRVAVIVTNNPQAGVIARASQAGVPLALLPDPADAEVLFALLQGYSIQLVVLAGYLKKIPPAVVAAYPGRIVNIHPALLPKFGGKGMYGLHVHKAVLAAGETTTGITIHTIDEVYDRGEILFQASLAIDPTWSAEQLQQAVLQLEHTHYPRVVEQVALAMQKD